MELTVNSNVAQSQASSVSPRPRIGQRKKVAVAALGKFKTIAQMVALLCLLYSVSPAKPPHPQPWMGDAIFHIGDWLLAAAALLTLWSGLGYLRAAWPSLKGEE